MVASQNGRGARDPIKCDSRLATKVIVPFHPSFYCMHSLPIRLTFTFTQALCHLRIPSLSYSVPRSKPPKRPFCPSPVLSLCPQADLGTGAGTGPAFLPFLCSDALPSVSPSSHTDVDGSVLPVSARGDRGHFATAQRSMLENRDKASFCDHF
jgi:hypothetical protein